MRVRFRRLASLLLPLALVSSLLAADIVPVGAFAKFSGPKDARDGYQLLLWRQEGTLIGRLNVWQSGEKQTGDFLHGVVDEKGIYFTVEMGADASSPSAKPLTMGLKGKIANNRLDGILWWDAERARVGDDDAGEKIAWPADRTVKLETFKNVTLWKDAADKTE